MNDPDLDRSLIEAARAELGPTDAERRRLRRSVATALGAAAAGTAVSGAQATAAASAGVASWKVTALVVAGLSTAVAGGVAWTVTGPEHEAPSPHRASSSERAAPGALSASTDAPPIEPEGAEEPARSAPIVDEASGSAALAPAPSTPQGERPGRANPPPRPASVGQPGISTQAPTEAASAALPPPEHALIRETALLQSAHHALRSADPERALGLLQTHAARYPEGILREERAATRVLTLCALERRAEARAEAAAFLAAHPSSMHAPRIRAACAAP